MKNIYTKSMGKLATGVLLALGTVFATGCAKDAKQDVNQDTGEGRRVVVRVEGINDGGAPALKAKAGGVSSTLPTKEAKLIQGEGFDVFVSQSNKIEKSENNNRLRSSAGPLRSAGLGDGFAYRVFLYESGALAASELFASGT